MTRLRGFARISVATSAGGLLLLAVFAFRSGLAQAQSAPVPLALDVVSIKPSGAPKWLPAALSQMTFRGRQYRADPVTAGRLILEAFQIKEWQLAGAADWVTTDRFTMEATVNTDVSIQRFSAEFPELLKHVLEDRFQLRVHKEQRRFRGYALVRARDDGRLGPRLRESKADCDAPPAGPAPAAPGGPAKCSSINGPNWIGGTGLTMQRLADLLTGGNGIQAKTDRLVVNRTELPGRYDVLLDWSPDVTPGGNQAQNVPPVPPQAPDWLREAVQAAPTPNGTSIFTALREQLGLKLDARDEQFDVVVIDRMERPSPN